MGRTDGYLNDPEVKWRLPRRPIGVTGEALTDEPVTASDHVETASRNARESRKAVGPLMTRMTSTGVVRAVYRPQVTEW
jgi:hypothetical protein